MEYLRVKNWESHQHYKDRNPPWIKFHRTLLDDYDFAALPDESKAHLLLIWLLASQREGVIPNDPKFIGEKIGARKRVDMGLLVQRGFLIPMKAEQEASDVLADGKQDASSALASRKQNAPLEEKRREEKRTAADEPPPFAGVRVEVWRAWRRHRKGKLTPEAIDLQARELAKFAGDGDDPNAVIEQSICNGWTGLFPLKNKGGGGGHQPAPRVD